MSVSIIPESAPFNAEQRAWLNGFLAGWAGVQATAAVDTAAPASSNENGVAMLPAPVEEAEEFPWHDSGLSIEDRLTLAEGKPLKRRLMAAMAQLNCGACGYQCLTYSEAIATGEEKNLTLCSPGGKETAKALKRLVKETPAAIAAVDSFADVAQATGYSRANPYKAVVKASYNLNREGSSKHTSHVVIGLGDSGLTYEAGDSLGVYPTNCPELVAEILNHLGLDDNSALASRLILEFNLRDVSGELLELLARETPHPDETRAAATLVDSDELDSLDILDVLRKAPSARLGADDFVACLSPLAPRLYSIASSLKAHPDEVHLTVGKATTRSHDRVYKGVTSTMFSDRIVPGNAVRIFVQTSHGFSVPANPSTPIIMVGPGTGVAPFRAFLQERQATGAVGRNWLFFGDQHEACDFIYREELAALHAAGLLTRLSTAFSRDQNEKVYVQDRMKQAGAEIWAWLEEGASFYVCGDAKRMAADVDRALHDIVIQHGRRSPDEAKAYVSSMKTSGRYARDVY